MAAAAACVEGKQRAVGSCVYVCTVLAVLCSGLVIFSTISEVEGGCQKQLASSVARGCLGALWGIIHCVLLCATDQSGCCPMDCVPCYCRGCSRFHWEGSSEHTQCCIPAATIIHYTHHIFLRHNTAPDTSIRRLLQNHFANRLGFSFVRQTGTAADLCQTVTTSITVFTEHITTFGSPTELNLQACTVVPGQKQPQSTGLRPTHGHHRSWSPWSSNRVSVKPQLQQQSQATGQQQPPRPGEQSCSRPRESMLL